MAAPSALLSIVQRACDMLPLPRPALVALSTDPQVRQLLALLHQEGAYLMNGGSAGHYWSVLRTLYTFQTVASTATYAVPSDFDRYIPDTFWDRTNNMKVLGPDVPQVDRWRQESTTGQAGIRKHFRLIGGNVQLFPTPDSVATIVYEYISSKWVRKADATPQTEFLLDTDTTVFDPYLMILGLRWRFAASKGFSTAADFKAEYDDYFAKCIGKDNAGETLAMNGEPGQQFISLENLPDTGYAV